MEQNQHFLKIGSEPIGRHKYNHLKSIVESELTPEQKEQIEFYESRFSTSEDTSELKKEYSERIFKESEVKEIVLTKKWLWLNFLKNFEELTGKEFEQNENSIENVKVVMYYFLKDEKFFKCENLIDISFPSFTKGLLIVGNYGNGKTSIMNAIQKTLYGIKGYTFRSYNSNEVVKLFESINNENFEMNRKDFDQKMCNGDVYFDDLKTEREASNYGKVNLFKEIIELRSSKNFKTYGTCNFDPKHPNDIVRAVDEFALKYGERVYDRIFQMFNIIEFKGKSFRK